MNYKNVMFVLFFLFVSEHNNNAIRHIVAKNPRQPKDGLMLPAMLWNDSACLKLMPFKAQQKFNSIKYGPYKSDLCRLFVMYRYGGVYTDQDIFLFKTPKGPLLIEETSRWSGSPGLIMNALMVSDKHNPFFKRAIKIMMTTKENDPHRKGLWGPWALLKSNPNNFTILKETCPRNSPCSCGVSGLFKSHDPCRY